MPSDSSNFKTFLCLELSHSSSNRVVVRSENRICKTFGTTCLASGVLSEGQCSWKGKRHRLKKIFFFSDAPSAYRSSSSPSQRVRLNFLLQSTLGVAVWQTLARKMSRKNTCRPGSTLPHSLVPSAAITSRSRGGAAVCPTSRVRRSRASRPLCKHGAWVRINLSCCQPLQLGGCLSKAWFNSCWWAQPLTDLFRDLRSWLTSLGFHLYLCKMWMLILPLHKVVEKMSYCVNIGPCYWHLGSTHAMIRTVVISPGGLIIPICKAIRPLCQGSPVDTWHVVFLALDMLLL